MSHRRHGILPWILFVLLGLSGRLWAAEGRFDVRDFGATGNGVALDTAAVQKAIDACAAAGGGQVLLPKGRYLTGSLELKSGVHLVVAPEAVLLGSRNVADYPLKKLLWAKDVAGVSIEGGGVIDAQGHAFWEKEKRYEGPAWRGTAQFEYRALPRPSFIHFQRCRDVVLQNVTLKDSPAWTVHLERCSGARLEKVVVRNELFGPNTDGFDINSCVDVLVRGCDLVAGDDGIVLKSTQPGHDHPSRNITVEGCRIWSSCNALKIGTETHDTFENITFRNCHLYADSDRPLDWPIAGVAIESVDGACLSGITVENITMRKVRVPIFVRLGHRGGNSPRTQQVEPRVPGKIEKVVLRNIKAQEAILESSITGIPGHRVGDVTLENVHLEYEGGGKSDWVFAQVPDESRIRNYPEAWMFGRLPASGLYCRHVEQVRLRDVTVSFRNPDPRPVLVGEDVQDLLVERLVVPPVPSTLPAVWLIDVPKALLRACAAPGGRPVFLAAEGSPEIVVGARLENCDTRQATTPLLREKPRGMLDAMLPVFRETLPGVVTIDPPSMRLLDPMTVQPNPLAPSGRCVLVPGPRDHGRGEALCRFEIATPGEYVVWVRALGTSGNSDSFFAAVDGHGATTIYLERLNAWHWELVRDREAKDQAARQKVRFTLDRGLHTLAIRNRESNTRIGAIVIVRADAAFSPSDADKKGLFPDK